MSSRANKTQEILLPASGIFIFFTLLAGLTLNLLPWQGLSLLIRPDFIVLILLFWCINQPRKIGLGTAWFLGLVMDVADGSLFGQHALAYTLVTFAALILHRRVLMFPLLQQALHIFPILLLLQLTLLLFRLIVGVPYVEWSYFLPSLAGMLLWPPLSFLLQQPQRWTNKPDNSVPVQSSR
ncbi:rod shape-determining protein MreD [Sulfurirhabdus autotrophica]|uniref:Rod shape-determining protein MreD n=1 Tax=Sulfurirhabdus autotrophica TaxID=1706046 RepID=A0A4R3Y8H5_9PROT|nr:rod shape-determining protein MreD [Sulfurirhabdus autotrophica]TCV88176.1 rod shape-determining protein MreD [Sulfurirhabdus autotrophica]